MGPVIKCKLCRNILLSNKESWTMLIDSHGRKQLINTETGICINENLLYIDEEELPDWIFSKVENAIWSKGKLNCPHCNARIGAFDFVSRSKCNCSKYILPAVHIVNSKIDIIRT